MCNVLYSSVQSPCLIRLYNLHLIKTCLTIWFLYFKIQSPILMSLLWNKYLQSPIFFIRIYISNFSNRFVNFKYSLIIPLFGDGFSLCNMRLRVFVAHFCFYSSKMQIANCVFFAKMNLFTCYILAIDAKGFFSLVFHCFKFFNFYSFAFFADLSAVSLPSMSIWVERKCNLTVKPSNLRLSILFTFDSKCVSQIYYLVFSLQRRQTGCPGISWRFLDHSVPELSSQWLNRYTIMQSRL